MKELTEVSMGFIMGHCLDKSERQNIPNHHLLTLVLVSVLYICNQLRFVISLDLYTYNVYMYT